MVFKIFTMIKMSKRDISDGAFSKNCQQPLTINYFQKKAISEMFDRVLNKPLYFYVLQTHVCF